MARTVATTIVKAKRIENDVNGNPRWELQTERGTYRTPAGSGWIYGAGDLRKYEGKYVVIHLNGRGTVDKIV